MCTLSFYKDASQIIITSNRDENYQRKNALEPKLFLSQEHQLVYCKDAKADGTWMAMRHDKTIVVLLNGAYIKHQPQAVYRKSRGLVVLDIINQRDCLNYLKTCNLSDIEPFTIILYSEDKLYEFIWDGGCKHIQEKHSQCGYLWSSVTLYDSTQREYKNNLFQYFIENNPAITAEDIFNLHTSDENSGNGFVINRSDQMITFSITQVVIKPDQQVFIHHDMLNKKEYTLLNPFSL